MAKEEIDVVALKNSLPDMRGKHLWELLRCFGVPVGHGVFYGKYSGYETYEWCGCGGTVEYYFNSQNICVTDDIFEFVNMFKL